MMAMDSGNAIASCVHPKRKDNGMSITVDQLISCLPKRLKSKRKAMVKSSDHV